ncbi:hypothetical protein [Metabacillus fastidiosus]|uniref:hypothetical protein n=1 Tax=Metabacillus fastidiosus TaxID=1458 RepID=UPI003D2E37C9
MALAGSVTFAVTNALLAEQSSKRSAAENAFIISGDQSKVAIIRQSEKLMKDQIPIIHGKEDQTGLPHNISTVQLASQDTNKNDGSITVIHQDTKTVNKSPALHTASIEETKAATPVVKTVSVTSAKAPVKTAASTPARTNTTNTVKTTGVTMAPKNTITAPATRPKPTGTDTTNKQEADKTTVPQNNTEAPSKQTPSTPEGNKVTSTDKTTTANRGQQVSQAAKEKAANNRDKKENNGKKM